MSHAGVKFLKWLPAVALVTVLVSPGALLAYQWGLDLLAPVTSSSLVFTPVELGVLRPGEKRAVDCAVHNRGRRTLRLLPPTVSCGCVSVDNGPSALTPGESTILHFTLHAPDSARMVNERIVLQATDFPEQSWVIGVHGQVQKSADIWAKPAQVELVTDDPMLAEAVVHIHHNNGVVLGKISANSPDILLEQLPDEDGLLLLKVRVSLSSKSLQNRAQADIDIMSPPERGGKKLLSIPVSWRPLPKITWVPRQVRFEGYGDTAGEVRRTVVVRGLTGREAEQLKVEPLGAWVRVEGRDVTGNLIRLRLAFDTSAMPERIDQAILQLCPGGGTCETVTAYGRRQW